METLDVAINTVNQMATMINTAERPAGGPTPQRLTLHLQTLYNLRARSQALDARLRNKIGLVSTTHLP